MKTALITGANKGIGYETTYQFLKLGHSAVIGARNHEQGKQAVQPLHDEGLKSNLSLKSD